MENEKNENVGEIVKDEVLEALENTLKKAADEFFQAAEDIADKTKNTYDNAGVAILMAAKPFIMMGIDKIHEPK